MKKRNIFIISNLLILIVSFAYIIAFDNRSKDRVMEYCIMLASKITKYVVNEAYIAKEYDMNENSLFEVVYGNDGEIKTIIYDTMSVNSLLNAVTDKVYEVFDKLETGNIKDLNIRENILTNNYNNVGKNGIVLEIPGGIFLRNYFLANLGPKIPIRISLTGEFESHISTEVKEYGLNNALIEMYIDIRVTEQVTMPFISEKIVIENQIPISLNIINGKIPDYYLNGFDRMSNVYQVE